MAQEQESPVQSLLDWGNKLRSLPGKFLGTVDKDVPAANSSSSGQDTSWHDEMVKRANASFDKPNNPAPIVKPKTSSPAPKAPTGPKAAQPNKFEHGGKVEKTGLALVHEGEHIIPKDEVDKKDNDMSDKKKMETVHLSHHRVVMHLHRGGLHRALGIPEGETIPKEKIEAATHSSNPHIAKMAHLAQTFASFHHGGK